MKSPEDGVPLFDARDSIRDAVEKLKEIPDPKRAETNHETIPGERAAKVAFDYFEDADVQRKCSGIKGGHDATLAEILNNDDEVANWKGAALPARFCSSLSQSETWLEILLRKV